ncbi:MAG: hypothetical protein QOD63_2305 [Actinomycetota bacterium]|jgi:hypothetical protein|nr:hypothetical protein [Actinomycetota bacterium]
MNLDASRPVTLAPDEAEELHWLLGQLEDWLRHADDDVVAGLVDFVHDTHRDSPLDVVDILGRYGVELRRRAEGGQR